MSKEQTEINHEMFLFTESFYFCFFLQTANHKITDHLKSRFLAILMDKVAHAEALFLVWSKCQVYHINNSAESPQPNAVYD